MSTNNRIAAPLLAATFLAASMSSGAVTAADLSVTVNGLKTSDGRLMINVVTAQEQMADATNALASLMLSAHQEGVSFTLHNLSAGTYGIQLFHDENNNGELDANLLGIPKEPWAFSNNAAGKFGPPKWQDIRFEISPEDTTVTQTISVNH